MKQHVGFFILFLTLLLLFSIGDATEWINYMHGGRVPDLFEISTTIWAATHGGLLAIDKTSGEKTFYNPANSELPGTPVYCLALDQDNNLWIGTAYGLARFDGTEWEVYTMHNSPLPENSINVLAVAPNGDIWIGAQAYHWEDESVTGGLVHFDGANWTVYTPQNSELPDNLIQSICIDSANNVWLGFESYWGVVKFDGLDWLTYTNGNSDYIGYPASSIAASENGDIWIGGFGLTRFDGENWSFWGEDSGLPDLTVTCLHLDSDQNIWIGMTEYVARFDGENWLAYPVSSAKSVLFDGNQNLWVGTARYLLQFDGSTWHQIDHSNSALASNFVTGFAQDPAGQTWFANELIYEGLSNLIRVEGPQWVVQEPFSWAGGGLAVNAMVIDQNDTKWLATQQAGLVQVGPDVLDPWVPYQIANSSIPSNEVNAIVQWNDLLWLGTQNGLASFDGQNWVIFSPQNSDLPSQLVTALAVDPTEQTLWIGTQDAGLAHFDGATWTVYDESNSGLPASPIQDVLVTASGEVWLGTQDAGLVHFDGVNWDIYDTTNSDLPDDWINALALDADGSIFVGMRQGGLARFDGTDWQVFIPENSGMPHTLVRSLAIDGAGNKWIGTAGLTIFNEGGIMAVEDAKTPETAANVSFLQQNYPNPWFLSPAKGHPSTTIAFNLPSKHAVTLRIYNTAGQLVKTLLDGTYPTPAGTHEETWDGRNDHGLPVSSGVYFYRLEASATNSPPSSSSGQGFEGGQGDVIQTRRMVLLR